MSPDYNTKGEPNLKFLLKQIRQDIQDLQVVDPRLELLRQRLFDLSVQVEEIQERINRIESHEDTGLYIARSVAIAAFVVLVVLVSRYL